MKKLYLILIFFAFFNIQKSFAQTGVAEDFNDDNLDAGWESVPDDSKFILTEANGVLQIDANSVGADWSNLEFNFPAQNISNNPRVKLQIKTNQSFTMRIDVIDNNGNSNNSSVVSKSVSSNDDYTEYIFNYDGNFGSADASAIRKVVIFLNPGGPSFSGTVYFDNLIIGDSIQYLKTGPIRVNQVGYELTGSKIAVLEKETSDFSATTFELIDSTTQEVVFTGNLEYKGQVNGWQNRYFWTANFSQFETAGKYRLKVNGLVSHAFEIKENLFFEKTAFSAVDFFKGMRHTGTGDQSLSFNGTRSDIVNMYGGWWDATGDPGKHISHLSYANYFNPQQIPMVVWSLLKSYNLDQNGFSNKESALKEEAAWGADYLLRSLDPAGYFYLSIFDEWGNAPESREICEWGADWANNARSENYQCAFREGGGLAIAALARAYYMNVSGDSSVQQYLEGAKRAYAHLNAPGSEYATKNLEYCNDHEENIIDDYCALLAAVELYKATGTESYKTDAQIRADNLLNRQTSEGWFISDNEGNRPFYHAADEGLPIVGLLEFMDIDNSRNAQILPALRKSLNWYYSISEEVVNPFSYTRQYSKSYSDGTLESNAQKRFFLPHNNETGYWWQGENARLASMTTALLLAARELDPGFKIGTDSISRYAISQLDWILGKNPFDICMLYGFGEKNYPHYPVPQAKDNIVGGICNGITAKDSDENDLDWAPYSGSNGWENWRWIEQWLPHDSWYLLAVSSISHINNTPSSAIAEFGNISFTPSTAGLIVEWSTLFEINGKELEILKSVDNNGFVSIGKVDAAGSETSETGYSFTDNVIEGSSVIYKIKFTDLNGNSVESNPVSATVTNLEKQLGSGLKIFPNPFSHQVNLDLEETKNVTIIRIKDTSGRIIKEFTDLTQQVVFGENLPKGIYFVEVVTGEDIKTKKILKL